jgi:hypothetical protein
LLLFTMTKTTVVMGSVVRPESMIEGRGKDESHRNTTSSIRTMVSGTDVCRIEVRSCGARGAIGPIHLSSVQLFSTSHSYTNYVLIYFNSKELNFLQSRFERYSLF